MQHYLKKGQYKIGLRECNIKYKAKKNSASFKAYFRTSHQELKGVADKTMADSGFQLEHIVEKVVEGLENVLKRKYNDTEENLFQMTNVTSQSTQILPQLLQKMQQMQTLTENI